VVDAFDDRVGHGLGDEFHEDPQRRDGVEIHDSGRSGVGIRQHVEAGRGIERTSAVTTPKWYIRPVITRASYWPVSAARVALLP
jgi:hypothetical protein